VVGVLEGYLACVQEEFERRVYRSNLSRRPKECLLVQTVEKLSLEKTSIKYTGLKKETK